MPGEKKRISKSELREDQFVEWIMAAADYVRERLQLFIAGAVGIVALVVVIQLIIQSREQARVDAAVKLGKVLREEEEGRPQEAMRLSEELIDEYEGTPATAQGVVFLANRYFTLGRYADAQRLYQTYLNDYGKLDILVFAAWNGLAACFEAQGHLLKAASKYQEYVTVHGGTTQAALSLLEAARCYGLAGDIDNQKQVLERVIKEYGDSPAATRAREEKNML